MAAAYSFGLFSDEVFSSTDLNRRSGEVLNQASKNPVTIARNNERFALLKREQAASLLKGMAQLVEVVQIAKAAIAVQKGDEVPVSAGWIEAFDPDDRLLMLSEVLSACDQAAIECEWDRVGDLVHEWKESAGIIQSGVAEAAKRAELDEQALTPPWKVVREADE